MQTNYRPALEMVQKALRALDPLAVADRSGADLVQGEGGTEFRLKMLGRQYRVPMPEALVYDPATGAEAGTSTTLVILHYLADADGSPVTHQWIPFRTLPGGNVYEKAFRHQCLDPLVAAFGPDPDAMPAAAEALEGERATMGDISYTFQALPRLPMACVLWRADEEQDAEVNLLFDAVAPHCLPTEDLTALGRALTFGLIRQRERKP